MLGKTLILGLISAGAAGAIVYYGTAPQGSEATESHPHFAEKSEKSSAKTSARKSISPKLPTIRKADMDDGRQELSGKLPSEDDDAPETKSVAETDENGADEAPKRETRWLDQYLKKNKSDKVQEESKNLRAKLYEDSESKETKDGGSDMASNSYTVVEKAAINDIEPDSMPPAKEIAQAGVTDPRTFRIENGKLVEIDPTDTDDNAQMEEAQRTSERVEAESKMHKSDHKGAHHKMDKPQRADRMTKKNYVRAEGDITTMANDSTPLLATVMSEAAEINKSELRDQAYFEITEYALSEGRFDSARLAHDMIEQDELSYTAKSRIAVAYAQSGKPTKAFKVISEVNEPELRDFMRLQVIEALVAPERLPQAWQNDGSHKGHHHDGLQHSGAGQ
jgi:hypothetical protein